MHTSLTTWLEDQRPTLLPRWAALLAETTSAGSSIITDAAARQAADHVAVALYTAALSATEADNEALKQQLQTLGDGSDSDLPSILDLVCKLGRTVRMQLYTSVHTGTASLALLEALDDRLNLMTSSVAEAWSAHNQALIYEREFITEQLVRAYDAADRHTLQLQSLNVISQQLSATLEVDQLFDRLINNLQQLTGVAHLAIWQPLRPGEAAAEQLVLRYAQGSATVTMIGMQLDPAHPTDLVARAYRSAGIQFEMHPDPARHGPWLQPDCGALVLPMHFDEQTLAIVVLQDPDPASQLRMQQDLAWGVVSQSAIAMRNARLYAEVRALNADLEARVIARTRELQEEKDRLATINQIATEVSSTLDLDLLLNTSLQLICAISQPEHASIMLVDPDGSNLLITRAVLGVPPITNPKNYLRFPLGSGIAGWVAQHRTAVLIDDIASDERWVAGPGLSARKRQGAMVAVPLIAQGEVIGVLSISHTQTGYFHEGHLRMLSACAGAIAIGINNANLFQIVSAEAVRRSELIERQQQEASQIQAILQSLSDGVLVCDPLGNVLVTNPAAAMMLDRSVEELLLANVHELIVRYLGLRKDDLPLTDLLQRPQGRDGHLRQFRSILKLGPRTLNLSLGPVLKEDGTTLGALLLLHDISREIEVDRLKTEFIGTMSHELRTPMTAIKGFTQLLGMGGLGLLNETQREFVQRIDHNTEHMIELINNVLDITKLESGSVELEWRPLHMAEALSGVMIELKDQLSEHGHNLTITLPPGLPLVRADARRLHQVLYHLLLNAIKYTPAGGQIWIEAFETSQASLPEELHDSLVPGRRYTQLNIRDTGVGIAEHDLPRIFERFYRGDNPLKIEAGGAGLGLALVRPLIELLGGYIWVRSTPAEHTSFSFILPAL